MHRSLAIAVAALVVTAGGCATHPPAGSPAPPPSARSAGPAAPTADVAAPYNPPARPPQQRGPLEIRPSKDAGDRLSRVLTGKLLDSGNFHAAGFHSGDPLTPDPYQISFTTPSGKISCTGSTRALVCESDSASLPRPPRPTEKPPGNWEPYIELGPGDVTYGVTAGNPMVPDRANTLPYGSTLRFGEIDCLSDRDGITCVHIPSSTGFHLSRDDLTPMKAITPVPLDTRVEPRTPGNTFCGALVSAAAQLDTATSLPNNAGLHWTEMGTGDYYTCRDVQLFELSTNDPPPRTEVPNLPIYVLVFDRGHFVGSATDHPYPGLKGQVDDSDPTLIHLTFVVLNDGRQSHATARARYRHGATTLLDPVPAGAFPST